MIHDMSFSVIIVFIKNTSYVIIDVLQNLGND